MAAATRFASPARVSAWLRVSWAGLAAPGAGLPPSSSSARRARSGAPLCRQSVVSTTGEATATPFLRAVCRKASAIFFAPLKSPSPPSASSSPSQQSATVVSGANCRTRSSKRRLGALKVSNSSMNTARPSKKPGSNTSTALSTRSEGSMAAPSKRAS